MVSTNQSLVKVDKNLIPIPGEAKPASKRSKRKDKVQPGRKKEKPTFPPVSEWVGVLAFMSLPALVILFSSVSGTPLPKPLLYGIAVILGLYLMVRAYFNVELVLAVAIVYIPFSKVIVIPIAPGLNGTNVFLLLLLVSAFFQAQRKRIPLLELLPGAKVVFGFAFLSALSGVTLSLRPGGFDYFMSEIWLTYKAWLDQFILYFAVLSAIRDRELAKRVVIYTIIGSMLVVFYSVDEMLERAGRSNLDRSRVGGPLLQPNNFGGFVAYTMLPIIAIFVMYIERLKAWLITPYLLVALKLLITSFSRGAYVALAAGGLLIGYLRGKGFLAFWLSLMIVLLLIFPSLIPESIVSRLSSTEKSVSTTSQQLDKSSQTRLVMWEAAIEMTAEDPIFGKGFKAFPLLKQQYVDVNVFESDPHSMYFYISSQMGIPTLVFFMLMLLNMYVMGRKLAQKTDDRFIRGIAVGGAGVATCMAVINVFGSRFINIEFTCYFLIYYVVLQYLLNEQLTKEKVLDKAKKKRRNFPRPENRLKAR